MIVQITVSPIFKYVYTLDHKTYLNSFTYFLRSLLKKDKRFRYQTYCRLYEVKV